MELSNRLDRIKPSSTMAVTARVLELKAEGRDVIGFAAGEPDFDTWDNVCEAAHAAITGGAFHYTAVGGTAELKNAIVTKLSRDNGLDYKPTEVMATCGGKHAIFNSMQSLLNHGDEVLIPAPYWVSYADMTIMADAVPKFVYGDEANGFKLSAETLEAAISPKTRMIMLNSPSNPTGATYNRAELVELAKVMVRHDVIVMSDDVYEFIRYDGEAPSHVVGLEPELRDRTVIVNSVSKTYAMTGWRIGYVAGPDKLIKAIAKIQGQQTSNPSSIAQAAACEALAGPQDRLASMVEEFKRRRDYICDRVNAIDGLSVAVPQGAFYVFVNAAGVFEKTGCSDGDALALKILNNASVGLVGGNDFGSPDHFRISYATSMEQIEKGMDAISSWLSSL